MIKEFFRKWSKKDAEEQTTGQVSSGKNSSMVSQNANANQPTPPANIATWREMRKDPTLALARAIANAPVRTANVTVVGDRDENEAAVEMVERFVDSCWSKLIADSLFSRDYGFQPFEIVYHADDDGISIASIKPLLPDITQVILNKNGDYMGLINGVAHDKKLTPEEAKSAEGVTVLDQSKSLWISNEREGDDYYGESYMERARQAWDTYNQILAKEKNYATTIAGPIPFVTFPDSEVEDENGQKRPASEMAATLIRSLQNAQGVAIPSVNMQLLTDQNHTATDFSKLKMWDIGFVESGNAGPEFLEMERARDKEKFRAWLVPERAGLEGEFGTKAEAETHGSLVLTISDLFLQGIVDIVNRNVVDRLLYLNFGEDAVGTVKLQAEKKDRAQMALLQDLVKGLFGQPVNVDRFDDVANVKSIFELLGIPMREEEDEPEENEEPPEEPDDFEMDPPEEKEELSAKPNEGDLRQHDGVPYRYSAGKWVAVDEPDGE